ncbi:MAG TPA: NAD(P)-dependent oxidoreductase [Vicinamibacterales bacterium]|nr:NAD(P)-dependent oxidoreductase [Vicinamibacterales bacterium]
MNVFVAGGTGAIGGPLVRALVAAGHQVTALTRSVEKADFVRRLGATPAIADALDPEALRRVVVAATPTYVIHQLTSLPKGGPRSARELAPTNRLRVEGTRNLIEAAVAAHARRIVVGSFALFRGAPPADAPAEVREAAVAAASMEYQTMEASRTRRIEGIVLRYGMFYGPEAGSTVQMIAMARRRMLPRITHDRSLLPCIHVEDAASATVAALTHGRPGEIYDVVDDRAVSFSEIVDALAKASGAPRPLAIPAWIPRLLMPYMARIIATRLPLSNAKAKLELAWRPAFPTIDEGLAHGFEQAA